MSDEQSNETEQAATEVDTAVAEEAVSEEEAKKEEQEAINALSKLSPRLFGRLCRGIPMRTFLAELARIDRGVYFRYFKGYRPVKITAKRLQDVLGKEILQRNNGLLAQLVIYNWDEFQWKLYGDLQKHVKSINEDVEAIESISAEEADPIFDDLLAKYDPRDVAIAAMINGVRVGDDYLKARFPKLL
ncbi:MAG: hypothetical protein KC502_13220 [Myxococcales bacterium]|nr:hypothetical protein [Myxococcales bacterium]